MAYINLITKEYPRYEGDIRLLYPDMGDEFICPEDFALVNEIPAPEFDKLKEKPMEIEPIERDGQWYRQWKLEPLSDEEKIMHATYPRVSGDWYWNREKLIWIDKNAEVDDDSANTI